MPDGELESLATHELDEYGQGQLAAPLHLPRVGPLGRQDADADVADQFGVESALDEPGRELGAGRGARHRGARER